MLNSNFSPCGRSVKSRQLPRLDSSRLVRLAKRVETGGQGGRLPDSKIGFSLLEVMLTLFILSVGFIFYLSASQTTMLTGNVDHKTIAHQVASKKIESIKALSFQNWPQNGAFTDQLLNSLPQGQANLTISNFDPQGKLKKIKVDVLWNERGTQKQYTAETLIYVP